MKLGIIYNVWDGWEWLNITAKSFLAINYREIFSCVVAQEISNWGEVDTNVLPGVYQFRSEYLVEEVLTYTPPKVAKHWADAYEMERTKREMGMNRALKEGCTHILHMDCDEYFDPADIAQEWEYVKAHNQPNTARYHRIMTYFKTPDLRFEQPDITIIPGITPLSHWTKMGRGEGIWSKKKLAVDPTRQISCLQVEESPYFMHHFSYIRSDIEKKFRNSTAKGNIYKPEYIQEYERASEGSVVSFMPYGKLIRVKPPYDER
jgi:hypothetical protein